MTCANPNFGYRKKGTKNKLRFEQSLRNNSQYEELILNCKKCKSCKFHSTRTWSLRCDQEASMHKNNTWVTLTYRNSSLPPDSSLWRPDLKYFIEDLRKKYVPKNPKEHEKITYFACGEYGEQYGRPHYHICLFNFKFPDQYFHKYNKKTKVSYFRSPSLERLWPNGFSDCSELTAAAAAYTARYCLKKKYGVDAIKAYNYRDPETGEKISLTPEFVQMSTNPAIGKRWWIDNYDDTRKDFIMWRGQRHSICTYYDKLEEKLFPDNLALKKIKRREALENQEPITIQRRETVNKILQMREKRLIRAFEANHHD